MNAKLETPPVTQVYVDAGVTDNGNRNGKQSARICIHDGTQVIVDEPIGSHTSNEAELLAVKRAFGLVEAPAIVISDSQLAVNLISRRWRAHKQNLKDLLSDIRIPEDIALRWVPRDQNKAGQYLESTYGI